MAQLAGVRGVRGGPAVRDGAAAGHHPGDGDRVSHVEHRGRGGTGGRFVAGGAGFAVPGDVGAGAVPPRVHGGGAGDHAEARGAAAVEPGGVPAAVLAVTPAGYATEVTADAAVTGRDLFLCSAEPVNVAL